MLIVAAAILVIAFFGLSKTRTIFAIHDIGDPKLSVALDFQNVREDFNLGSSMIVLFHSNTGSELSTEEITKIRKWIAVEDLTNSELLSTFSPFDIRVPKSEDNLLWYFRLLENNSSQELEKINRTPWAGILTNSRTRDFSTEFTFKAGSNSQFYGSFDPKPVGDLLKKLATDFKNTTISYYFAGEAIFQYYCHEGINRNHLLNICLLALFLITFRILFGTWRSGLVYVMTLSIMAIITFGCMAWTGTPIDLISSGLILMMAVAALEDYLFICYEQLQRGTGWRKTIRPILLASFCTSLTTMVGFGALYATDLLIMGRFGLWAAFGALIQWMATFILLPALMMKFPSIGKLANAKKAFRPELPENILQIALTKRSAKFLLLFFPIGLYALFHLHISGAPKDMMPKSHPFTQGLNELQNSRGWEGVVHLVFKDAQDLKNKSEILENIKTQPNIAKTISRGSIQNFLVESLDESKKNLVLSESEGAGIYDSFVSAKSQERVILYVKNTSTEPMMEMLNFIKEKCKGSCFATSESAAHAEFSEKVPEAFLDGFSSSMLIVSCLLLALVRFLTVAPRPYFSVLASSMWGPFVIITMFWIFDTKINFMACLFTNVLVGLTGDNAIQFLFTSRKERLNSGLSRRGGGSLLISLIIFMSCFVFLGSYFNSPKIYGMFLAFGILAATFGDVWILKAFNPEPSELNT